MELKRITVFIDTLYCCVLMPMIVMLVPVEHWIVRYPVFANLLVVYLYLLYLAIRKLHFPRLIVERRYGRAALFVIGFLTCAYLISHFPFPTMYGSLLPPDALRHLRIQTVWLLILVVTGFGMSVELLLELYKQHMSRKDVETAKNRAELALYKAQINPHFMFNTLNSLYGLVVGKSEEAEAAFIKFSEVLQYMFRHARTDTVTLRDELDYLHAYIELQSLRMTRRTCVEWESNVEDDTVEIAPMLLITFVENAFKYGVSSSRDSLIKISVAESDGVLEFASRNTIVREHNEHNGTPVGLENCRQRLEMLYGSRYVLEVDDSDGYYSVKLKIELK